MMHANLGRCVSVLPVAYCVIIGLYRSCYIPGMGSAEHLCLLSMPNLATADILTCVSRGPCAGVVALVDAPAPQVVAFSSWVL